MKKSVACRQMIGFIITSVLGTFLHFLFDLTGDNLPAALISAVNESIWEHTKLLFYPMFLFGAVEHFLWGKEYPPYWSVKCIGIVTGLLLIPVLYYTYTGILGISADWFNIAIFFLAAGASFYLETKLFQKDLCQPHSAAFWFLCFLTVVYTVFTFAPPHIPFFRDPVTGTYGFQMLL